MFPSEAYRELCIEKQKVLREEWEPRPGDWFYNPSQDKVHLLTRYNTWFIGAPKRFVEHNIPLFQPRQLIEMLEEREYSVVLDTCEQGSVSVGLFIMQGISLEASVFGPATALLKAYLEVVSQGGKEE